MNRFFDRQLTPGKRATLATTSAATNRKMAGVMSLRATPIMGRSDQAAQAIWQRTCERVISTLYSSANSRVEMRGSGPQKRSVVHRNGPSRSRELRLAVGSWNGPVPLPRGLSAAYCVRAGALLERPDRHMLSLAVSCRDAAAMVVVRVLEASLLISAVATGGVFAPIVQYQIYRRLRRRHRKVLDGLAISSPSFLWRDDRDSDDSAFERLLGSGSRGALQDPQLNVLWARVAFLRRLSAIGFALLLIALLVFWRDPGSIWPCLVDLGQY